MSSFKMPLTIQTYQSRDKSVSSQRLLNMYVEQMPADSKTSAVLFNTEGCKPYINITNSPIYGLHYMYPNLYSISGIDVYKLDEDGTVTNIGNIGATNGIVRSADNGSQILTVKPNGEGYITTDSAVTKIEDENFPVASDVAFIAQYFVVSQMNSGRFYWSKLLDGTVWSALGFATQESNPDNLVGLAEYRGDLWLFGDKTTEIWQVTGDPDLPFQRVGSGVLNIGCKAKRTIQKDKNSLYWLGNDLQVHMAQGYGEQRISTHDMEREFEEVFTNENMTNAYSFTYSKNGHDFYVITVPNSKTYVFDTTTKVWHEKKTSDIETWLPSCIASAFSMDIVGDSATGRLYTLDTNYFKDRDNDYIEREIIFPTVFQNYERIIYDTLYADIETGMTRIIQGQGSNPQVMLCWSDDGGITFKSERWRSFGKIGSYKKIVEWRQLGQSKQRIFKIRMTEPVKFSLSSLYVEGAQCYA